MSEPQHLRLDELDWAGALVELADAQAAALTGSGLVEVRPERSGWRVLPRGMVGSVRVGGIQVDVRPKDKVGLTHLLFLLGYARNPGFLPGQVTAAPEDDLWPALAESLVRLVRVALDPGVLQGYQTVEESRRSVRGRIRMGDQLTRHPGQMIPIEVTHDEFSRDIAENQILRAALRRMLAVPGLQDSARRSLAHLDGRLADVSIPVAGARLPAWRPTRLNQRYAPALRLAQIILDNLSAKSGGGDLQMAAFVVDMAHVYEEFVTAALREALARRPGSTQSQYAKRLDADDDTGSTGLKMSVDVVHVVDGRPRLVFDAKYKAADTNADHYQMLAYCTALEVPRAWLIYAGGGAERVRRIVNTGISVVAFALDLAAHPRDLLAQIDELAKGAWAAMEPSSPESNP